MEKDAGPFLHLSPQIKADFFILHLAADCTGLKVAYICPLPSVTVNLWVPSSYSKQNTPIIQVCVSSIQVPKQGCQSITSNENGNHCSVGLLCTSICRR